MHEELYHVIPNHTNELRIYRKLVMQRNEGEIGPLVCYTTGLAELYMHIILQEVDGAESIAQSKVLQNAEVPISKGKAQRCARNSRTTSCPFSNAVASFIRSNTHEK